MFHAKVKVLDIKVKVRHNKPVFNIFPNDTSHFVTIHLNDGFVYFDLFELGLHLFYY